MMKVALQFLKTSTYALVSGYTLMIMFICHSGTVKKDADMHTMKIDEDFFLAVLLFLSSFFL